MLFSTNTIKPQTASGTYIVQFSPLLHTLLLFIYTFLFEMMFAFAIINLNINHTMPEKWLFNLVGVFYVGLKTASTEDPKLFDFMYQSANTSEILVHEQTWIPLLL